MVNFVLTPPQKPLRAFLTVSVAILMVGTPETLESFSRPIFDLPPNPSIDHLVAVILKYPRREESGRRKSLNPGLMDGTIQDLVPEHRRTLLLGIRVNKPLINAPNYFEWHHG